MKKHIPFYLSLLLAPFLVFLLLSNGNGASFIGVTGSPGDSGRDCTACHSGANNVTTYNFSINVTTNIPAGGYTRGTTYQITLTPTANNGATEFGFQITAENAVASKVGVFTSTDANTFTDLLGKYVTHTFAGHEHITNWTFNWTAPATDVGDVNFYVAGITGVENSNGGTSTVGTQMILTTYHVGGVLGINKAQLLNFSMFPNPSNGQVTLQLPSDANQAQVNIFDYLGKTLLQKSINSSNNTLDVSNLTTGIYFVRIQTDTKVGTKKLIIR